jgi:hypothetical protein
MEGMRDGGYVRESRSHESGWKGTEAWTGEMGDPVTEQLEE